MKTRLLVGGGLALLFTFYFLLTGLDSKYTMLMWLWGALFGMALARLKKY